MLWKCTHCKYVFEHDEILALTTCEVQVRTLLQRAYAELSHDTSYKPSKEMYASKLPEHRLLSKQQMKSSTFCQSRKLGPSIEQCGFLSLSATTAFRSGFVLAARNCNDVFLGRWLPPARNESRKCA